MRLLDMIGKGVVDEISQMLSQGVALNPEKGVDIDTTIIPLFHALDHARGNYRIVEMLLQAGADPNIQWAATFRRIKMHLSPLAKAIYSEKQESLRYDVVRILLQYGANPNCDVPSGVTPQQTHYAIITSLLRQNDVILT